MEGRAGMSGEQPGCHHQEVGVKGWRGAAVVNREKMQEGFEDGWH